MDSWIICDLDGTLLNTGDLYLEARRKFSEFAACYFHISVEDAHKKQDAIDAELFKKDGYRAERFADSFADTLTHVKKRLKFTDHSRDELIKEARQIANNVFEQDPKEIDGAKRFLRDILGAGFKLGLITAGEKWVQRKRITNSGFEHLFHDAWIVQDKNRQVFVDFINKNRVDPTHSYMIGDSLRADIIPASQANLNAIYIPNKSTWKTVETDQLYLPRNAIRANSLQDVFMSIGTKYA